MVSLLRDRREAPDDIRMQLELHDLPSFSPKAFYQARKPPGSPATEQVACYIPGDTCKIESVR